MTTVNGQDVATGDIDDGRPERINVKCDHDGRSCLFCPQCDERGMRDETDDEYWARVEAMTPKCKEDLL